MKIQYIFAVCNHTPNVYRDFALYLNSRMIIYDIKTNTDTFNVMLTMLTTNNWRL